MTNLQRMTGLQKEDGISTLIENYRITGRPNSLHNIKRKNKKHRKSLGLEKG